MDQTQRQFVDFLSWSRNTYIHSSPSCSTPEPSVEVGSYQTTNVAHNPGLQQDSHVWKSPSKAATIGSLFVALFNATLSNAIETTDYKTYQLNGSSFIRFHRAVTIIFQKKKIASEKNTRNLWNVRCLCGDPAHFQVGRRDTTVDFYRLWELVVSRYFTSVVPDSASSRHHSDGTIIERTVDHNSRR